MKRAAVAAAILAAAAFTISPARAGGNGDINFFLGQKSLSSSDWAPIEDQFAFGAVMSFGATDWPVSIAADVIASADDQTVSDPNLFGNVTLTGATYEIDAGVRKIWKAGKGGAVRPYIGAGLGIISAAVQIEDDFGTTLDDGDAGFGFWGGAGIFFRLGSHFNIGADLRYSSADVDFDFGNGAVVQNVNAGGFSYGLLLGFGW